AFLTSFTHKAARHRLQLLRQRLGVLPYPQNTVFPQELLVLMLTLVFGRRRYGEAVWYEKIAPVPIRHLHYVTNPTHMVYIAHENDFHRLSPFVLFCWHRVLSLPLPSLLGQHRMVPLAAEIDPQVK